MGKTIHAILRVKNETRSWFAGKILKSGEFAYETDFHGVKIGDGITVYSALPYLIPSRRREHNKYLKVVQGEVVWADGYDDTAIWTAVNGKQNIASLETDVAALGFVKNTVNNLLNYYLKTETYTQAEVNALISGMSGFTYEIYASLSDITSPAHNVLYLIGPTGSGSDKYEEYVYPVNDFVKIGDTSIDLSGYVTTSDLNTALAAYTTTTDLTTLLAGYQTKIDANNKLDYSLLDNTPTIPSDTNDLTNGAGFITSSEQVQSDWNESDTSSPAYIDNKPSIPAAQIQSDWNQGDNTQADYIKNKPIIPAAQIQSDWNQGDNTALDYIKNKPAMHSIPAGGNAGQVLKKTSATDYDVHWANASETLPSAYCATSGSTAAKKANCSLYVTQANQYLQIIIGSANTYQGALTLNINSAGAKPIYINGTASSSSNYTLPNGTYFVFYDGTNYYFRTDGKLPMKDAAFGGSYNDLADKPTIPAAQVNSDWSANSGVAEILNKPTLGTASALNVPASGDAATTEVVKGDDSRLSDARTPTSHTHTTSEITDFPTIPSAPGTLDTTQTTTQSTNASEALSGSIKLHKISKTGAYSDLIGKPTIPNAVSGVNDGTNWTSITIGNETKSIPSGGGGGLTNYDYTEKTKITHSSATTESITFAANEQNTLWIDASVDLDMALAFNNNATNYIIVKNTSASAIDVTISALTYNGASKSFSIMGGAIEVAAGKEHEIGFLKYSEKYIITHVEI